MIVLSIVSVCSFGFLYVFHFSSHGMSSEPADWALFGSFLDGAIGAKNNGVMNNKTTLRSCRPA